MQKDLRKMACYLVVSEIGYMVGGAWLGNAAGLSGAIFHLLADALMTVCLFMFIACLLFKYNCVHLDRLPRLFKQTPITMFVFIVVAFSMIGVPPLPGFFSKWYLISGAVEAGQWLFVFALLFSSLVNAVLFFRIIENSFFSKNESEGDLQLEKGPEHPTGVVSQRNGVSVFSTEVPLSMLIPLVISGIIIIGLGLWNQQIMIQFIYPFLPKAFF